MANSKSRKLLILLKGFRCRNIADLPINEEFLFSVFNAIFRILIEGNISEAFGIFGKEENVTCFVAFCMLVPTSFQAINKYWFS